MTQSAHFTDAIHIDYEDVLDGRLPPHSSEYSLLVVYSPTCPACTRTSKALKGRKGLPLYALNLEEVPPEIWPEFTAKLSLEKIPSFYYVNEDGTIGGDLEFDDDDDLIRWLEEASATA